VAPFCALLSLLFAGSSAKAYSTESIASDACHEDITFDAIRRARAELPGELRLGPQTRDDRALVDDLPFDMPGDLADLAAATLVLGNRHVDLQGVAPDDLDELASIHGHPNNQAPHCLRQASHDGPDGDQRALAACREFILSKVTDALEGLSGDGGVDPAARVTESIYLQFRGTVDVAVPATYFRLGEALHALQDSFSHTYRTADHQRVIAVVNYVEYVEETHDPSEDGPPHSSALDRCRDLDVFRAERLEVVKRASTELLLAALDASSTPEERLRAVESVMDQYLSYEPGCTAENRWCDAQEATYPTSRGCVCQAPGAPSGSAAWLLGGALLVLLRWRRRANALAALALTAAVCWPRGAKAQPNPTVDAATTSHAATVGYVDGNASTPGIVDATPDASERKRFPFGASLMGSVALQNAAFAAALGARYRLNDHFLFGVDGEYNPFFSVRSGEIRSGVVNVYATGVVRFPLRFQRVNLRTTLNFGMSRLMFDLVGAPKGSMGLFVGGNLLGVDIELTRSLYLVINPAHIAVPIPQLDGVPYAYPQYRFSMGVQLGA